MDDSKGREIAPVMDDSKGREIADTFKATFQNNELFRKQSQQYLSPVTHLLRKKQQAHDIHQAMQLVKEDFNNAVVNQRLRKEELADKEMIIKGNLVKFDTFLKENEVKRVRAIKKAEHERELLKMKERELEVLSAELRVLSRERDRLAGEVDRNQLYPEYLLEVVKLCKQFDEPRQVMSRFATLVTTREDLLAGAKEGEESVNRALAQQAAFIEHSNDKIIHYSNQLAQLQTELDYITSQAMMWESRWVHIQNTAAKKTLLLGTIKMATLNLYTSMCGKDKPTQKGYSMEDTLEQLGKIQSLMMNLNGIMDEVRKFELKEQR